MGLEKDIGRLLGAVDVVLSGDDDVRPFEEVPEVDGKFNLDPSLSTTVGLFDFATVGVTPLDDLGDNWVSKVHVFLGQVLPSDMTSDVSSGKGLPASK
ncbi:hypothetical protein PM082_022570 [Marasmius tenuissimus]|nr:hypothetical protein PM082_022570 [Marasmius tenuissimus]